MEQIGLDSFSPTVGGDLSGTVGNATVIALYTELELKNIAPSSGNVLVFDGTKWNPTSQNSRYQHQQQQLRLQIQLH